MRENAVVHLEEALPREVLASRVAELRANGASVNAIAQALGSSWMTVNAALDVAAKRSARQTVVLETPSPVQSDPPYKKLAEQAAALRDGDGLTFAELAQRLGVNMSTATRAYNFAHRQDRLSAIEKGERPKNPVVPNQQSRRREEAAALLLAGVKPSEVAKRVGCGTSTVYRVLDRLRDA